MEWFAFWIGSAVGMLIGMFILTLLIGSEKVDEADRSDERIQRRIDEGIARARAQMDRHLPLIGVCHYCGDAVVGRTFCSKECSDDYDYEQKRRRAAGQ